MQRYVFCTRLWDINSATYNCHCINQHPQRPDTNSSTSFGQTLRLLLLIVSITDVWNDNHALLKAKRLKYRVAGNVPVMYP